MCAHLPRERDLASGNQVGLRTRKQAARNTRAAGSTTVTPALLPVTATVQPATRAGRPLAARPPRAAARGGPSRSVPVAGRPWLRHHCGFRFRWFSRSGGVGPAGGRAAGVRRPGPQVRSGQGPLAGNHGPVPGGTARAGEITRVRAGPGPGQAGQHARDRAGQGRADGPAGCGPDEVFDLLRRASQRANVKVSVLAAQIIGQFTSSGTARQR